MSYFIIQLGSSEWISEKEQCICAFITLLFTISLAGFLVFTSLTLFCFYHHKYRPFSTLYALSQLKFCTSFLPSSISPLTKNKDSLEPAQTSGFYMGTCCNLTETHKQTKIHPDLLQSAIGNLKAIKNSDFYLSWARIFSVTILLFSKHLEFLYFLSQVLSSNWLISQIPITSFYKINLIALTHIFFPGL